MRSPRDAEYIHLGIRVDDYQVAAGKSINLNLVAYNAYPKDDEPVFTSAVKFVVVGMCIWPDDRTNEKYEITIYEEDVERTEPKLRDIRARNKQDAPLYRKRRGRDIPVYNVPAGFCLLERNRNINTWQACTWVSHELVTDMLAVLSLSTSRPIYLSMDERMCERKRWIDNLRVQTNSPAEE